MLYQKYKEKKIHYENELVENMKILDEIYYNENNALKCPKCNNVLFYIENKIIHMCPFNEDKIYEINEDLIRNKSEFICEINNIDNLCVKHKKEFLYYKDSNYFCSECLRENNSNDYLNLDFIILSKEEIDNFKQLINDSEDLLSDIKEMKENLIKKLREKL